MHEHMGEAGHTSGGQRTTFRNQFSPSTMNSGHWTQVVRLVHLTGPVKMFISLKLPPNFVLIKLEHFLLHS